MDIEKYYNSLLNKGYTNKQIAQKIAGKFNINADWMELVLDVLKEKADNNDIDWFEALEDRTLFSREYVREMEAKLEYKEEPKTELLINGKII